MNSEPTNTWGWRIGRRVLIGLAILATVLAVFYTEEDWRGKAAWEKEKHALEARGEVLDWAEYIPAPVPDDQNFFTASSNILIRFKKAQTEAERNASLETAWLRSLGTFPSNAFPILGKPVLVAKMIVSSSSGQNLVHGTNHLVIGLDDPAVSEKICSLIEATIGHTAHGAAGYDFAGHALTNLEPAQIFLQTATTPSIVDLQRLVVSYTNRNIGQLVVAATPDKTVFEIQLTGAHLLTSAADYLAWSDQFEPAFDEIREALKRPYAILPGDYSQPYAISIPNFITMRALAQTLAQRAECYWLTGQPDKALREVLLIRDLCKILEKPPTHQPMTLVEAMINVAIEGLYASTVADGIRLNAWQEPQLKALQEQCGDTDLLPYVKMAFEAERANVSFWIGSMSQKQLAAERKASEFNGQATPPRWKDPLYLFFTFAPRGWAYQNMVVHADLLQRIIDSYDVTNDLVVVKTADAANDLAHRTLDRKPSPYTFLNSLAVPNFIKATKTVAFNQTMINEAQVACALERYRLAQGEYPETLAALVPQYMGKLPHDIVAGGSLIYRRADGGRFLLYSVGWDGKDDGGQKPPKNEYWNNSVQADWVWPN